MDRLSMISLVSVMHGTCPSCHLTKRLAEKGRGGYHPTYLARQLTAVGQKNIRQDVQVTDCHCLLMGCDVGLMVKKW